MRCEPNKILTFPSSHRLNIIDIVCRREWGGAGGVEGRDPEEEDVSR
jgi:hypothetical protein